MHPTTTLTPAVQSLLLYLTSQIGGDAVRTVVQIPLLLILADLVTGILSAVKRSVFTTARIADFVGQDLVKYLVCFLMVLVLAIIAGPTSPYTLIALVPMGSLAVSVAGSIIANLREIFPGDTVLVGAVEQELEAVVPTFTGYHPPPTTPSSASSSSASPPPFSPAISPTDSYVQLMQSLQTGVHPNVGVPPPPPTPLSPESNGPTTSI